MATNTAGTVARDLGIQAVHYLRKAFGFAELNGSATAENIVGYLPAGAVVLRCTIATWATFNDTTGDDIDVGYSAGGAELASAVDVNTAVIDVGDIAAADMEPLSTDKTVYFAPTTAGTDDGTTGAGVIIIEYVVDNDL